MLAVSRDRMSQKATKLGSVCALNIVWLRHAGPMLAVSCDRMSQKATKLGSICAVIYPRFLLRAIFCTRVALNVCVVHCVVVSSVPQLFSFSFQYLPSDWLERLL